MPPAIVAAARAVIFVIGAYFCQEYAAEYWVVGPLFGAVVLFWHFSFARRTLHWNAAFFLIASTLIYALVVWISRKPRLGDDAFYWAVWVGTILLPVAHALMLGASHSRAALAVPCIYGLWYGISSVLGQFTLPQAVQPFLNTVSIWQALYLLFLFGGKSKKPEPIGQAAS